MTWISPIIIPEAKPIPKRMGPTNKILDDEAIVRIRNMRPMFTYLEIAKKLGVSKGTVWKALNG